MFEPHLYLTALLFMLISMFCWGSWANTQKLSVGYAFQLFYWDYVFGLIGASLIWGFTLGSIYGGPSAFWPDLKQAGLTSIVLVLVGGAVFNVANLLLVAAIECAGLAVAFPVGIGLALVIGVVFNYLIDPRGNPVLLFGGMVLVVVAIIVDAMAYRRREATRAVGARGIYLSIGAGILMGLFYPFVAKSALENHPLGPYSCAFVFAIGVILCAIPVNMWIMRKPLPGGERVSLQQYWKARPSWHIFGLLGGVIWCTGALANFVASDTHMIGPAVSYAMGQGATMISAAWGVFVWREFASAPKASRRLIPYMFIFFLVGLADIAVAPLFH